MIELAARNGCAYKFKNMGYVFDFFFLGGGIKGVGDDDGIGEQAWAEVNGLGFILKKFKPNSGNEYYLRFYK